MFKLKVCGMRDEANITDLIALQPDFMGFIFHEKSPRNITGDFKGEVPKTIKKVGVFVNKDDSFIIEKASDYKLDFVQLHGNETPENCKKLKEKGFKIIKAFNISEDFDFDQLKKYETYCNYFLFDSFGKNAGGNGITFNWKLIQKYSGDLPFLLSGGINETMVAQLKNIVHPMFIGIDVNSGFELAPAVKDIKKIKDFKKELDI